MENIEYIDVIWFNGTIGLVKCFDEITKETKIYIGVGKGFDKNEDVKHIIEYGSKININFVKNFLNEI